jgi:hypothetical protein
VVGASEFLERRYPDLFARDFPSLIPQRFENRQTLANDVRLRSKVTSGQSWGDFVTQI